jgi:hypothetical protein
MRKFLLIAGMVAMASSMPALAQGQGKAKGASKSSASASVQRDGQVRGQSRTYVRARTDSRARERARLRTGATVNRTRSGIDDRAQYGRGRKACPPGLAKKTPACTPPGRAKQDTNSARELADRLLGLTN